MNVNVQKKCTAKVFLTVNLEKATVSVVFAAYVVFTLYKFIFYSFLPVHIVPSVVLWPRGNASVIGGFTS